MATKTLYHVAPVDAESSIKNNGLKAGPDGHIYVVTELLMINKLFELTCYLTDIIAARQVFLNEYLLIEIDIQGVTAALKKDNVDESTAIYQKRIKQKAISPEYLKISKRKLDVDGYNLFYEIKTLCDLNRLNDTTVLDDSTKKQLLAETKKRLKYMQEYNAKIAKELNDNVSKKAPIKNATKKK